MAIGIVYPYSADRTLVLVNGVPMTGLAGDEAVLVEPLADLASSKPGLDRSVSVSAGIDDRFKLTLRLQQGSPSNDVLSGFRAVGAARGIAFVAINVQNLLERSILVAPQSWFLRMPNVGYAEEAGDREWSFEGLATVWNVGGSF